jgi:hypothetical protein
MMVMVIHSLFQYLDFPDSQIISFVGASATFIVLHEPGKT